MGSILVWLKRFPVYSHPPGRQATCSMSEQKRERSKGDPKRAFSCVPTGQRVGVPLWRQSWPRKGSKMANARTHAACVYEGVLTPPFGALLCKTYMQTVVGSHAEREKERGTSTIWERVLEREREREREREARGSTRPRRETPAGARRWRCCKRCRPGWWATTAPCSTFR